jgi:DNA-binding beta-propeller fold protein YncE
MNELKRELLDSLDKFLIKEIILTIIYHYAAKYNSEKLVNKIIQQNYPMGFGVNDKNIFVTDIKKIFVYDKKNTELLYTFGDILDNYNTPISLINIEFNNPTTIIINGDVLYVTDSSNGQIQMFKINNNELSFYGLFGKKEKLKYPMDIVIFDDEIFVNDSGNNKIIVYDKKNYKPRRIFDYKNFKQIYGMALDKNFIFLTTRMTDSISVVDKKTFFVMRKIKISDICVRPIGIVLADDELFIVDSTNSKIIVIDKESGKLVRIISNAEIRNLEWITIYDDEIYCSSKKNDTKSLCILKRLIL